MQVAASANFDTKPDPSLIPKLVKTKTEFKAGRGGTLLKSQHLGGGRVQEREQGFEARPHLKKKKSNR